jgi:hypothetical protein
VAASSSAVDGHRLLAGRRTLQSVADPALLRLAGEARIGPVDATGLNVVVSLVRARLDLDAAYANRRRAEEAQALGCLRVGNVNEPDLRVDPELAGDALDERGRLRVVRAPVEVEDLDQRPGSLLGVHEHLGRAIRVADDVAHGADNFDHGQPLRLAV